MGEPLKLIEQIGKVCSECKIEKPYSEFSKASSNADGHQYKCKPCHGALSKAWNKANPEKVREFDRKRHKNNPKRSKKYQIKKYNLTIEEFNRLHDIQKGLCKICGESNFPKLLAVDHDHKTGEFRGLLCSKCNVGIGMFKDSHDIIDKASKYLKRFK